MTRTLTALAPLAALALTGCLVSQEPVIAEDTAAHPLTEAEYRIFAFEEDGSRTAEEFFQLERRGADYLMTERYDLSNEAIWIRLREVSDDLYAVQALEDDDDEYVYLAMKVEDEEPRVWFLDCTDLTDAEVAELGVNAGPFGTCQVPDWDALKGAVEILVPRTDPAQIWRHR